MGRGKGWIGSEEVGGVLWLRERVGGLVSGRPRGGPVA